jgi:pancreatic triacylglycerol lipase
LPGLDPSGPGWSGNEGGMTNGVAHHVEAIHTNRGGLGSNNQVAGADFFPNGGRNQPGCGDDSFCSHNRANELFASTVINDHLVGRECANLHMAEKNLCHGRSFNMGNANIGKRG